jgi:Zn-finger nucleic acid-binding protein
MVMGQLESGYRPIERWVQACERCGGAWVDESSLAEMVRSATAVAEARGASESVPRRTIGEPVVYRSCPSCGQMMHRRNFGRISGVVVDECRTCGTWFDAGELEAVLDFVRAGGLSLTDAIERREAERDAERERDNRRVQPSRAMVGEQPEVGSGFDRVDLEFEALAAFGRWVARWLRRFGRG